MGGRLGNVRFAMSQPARPFSGGRPRRSAYIATMADIQTATQNPKVTRREDYRAPDWRVPEIALDFDLDPAETRVKTSLWVERNGEHDRPLRLNGDGLTALAVQVDGAPAEWTMDGSDLVIPLSGGEHH